MTVSVKPMMSGKAFSFMIITPNRTYYAAAKNAEEMNQWIQSINAGILRALGSIEVPEKKTVW